MAEQKPEVPFDPGSFALAATSLNTKAEKTGIDSAKIKTIGLAIAHNRIGPGQPRASERSGFLDGVKLASHRTPGEPEASWYLSQVALGRNNHAERECGGEIAQVVRDRDNIVSRIRHCYVRQEERGGSVSGNWRSILFPRKFERRAAGQIRGQR